jgi:DNA-binding NarL/FixJ family response regulator
VARVLVIDDEALPARLIARFLNQSGHVAHPVVWMEDLEEATSQLWDVACVDLVFENQSGSGLDVLLQLSQLEFPPRLVLVCSIDQTRKHLIETAFAEFNIVGAIPKDAPEDSLLRCIDSVMNGHQFIDHKMQPFRTQNPALELLMNTNHSQILCALARGNHSQALVAAELGVAVQTVANTIRPLGDALHDAGLIQIERPKFNDILAWCSANAPFLKRWESHQTVCSVDPQNK